MDISFQESKGYEFESETDTETIAKLVKYMYDNRESDDISFTTLVERVIQQLVNLHLSLIPQRLFKNLMFLWTSDSGAPQDAWEDLRLGQKASCRSCTQEPCEKDGAPSWV